jgi:preprotein translocase subunit SecA
VFAEAKRICDEDHDRVVAAGGLHIIGTERHDSRRIDNQLRGRAGRQGDPGSSRFYLSLEDDLMKRFANDRVAGLMERLGLDDDVAIESRLVSKTIESAQTRVEGFNFDIRKRVVEFDDVINRQRETIYAERDKVLRNEDLTDTIRSLVDAELDVLVDQRLSAETPDGWEIGGLVEDIRKMGLVGDETTEDALWDIGTRGELANHLAELANAKLDGRESTEGGETWALVERAVLLRTIDSLWVEHLTEIDDMRRGIGLRGYAQQDPLNEFRREAYGLYEEFRGMIRHQVASSIFRVTVNRQAAAAAPAAPIGGAAAFASGASALRGGDGSEAAAAGDDTAARRAGATATMGGASITSGGGGFPAASGPMRQMQASLGDRAVSPASGPKPGYTPSGERIGRNDTCYCGSGLKYKKCHGR